MNFCISSLIVCSISKTSTTVSTDLSIALDRIFSSSEFNLTLCHVKRLPRKTSRALILLDCRHYQLKLFNDSSNSTVNITTCIILNIFSDVLFHIIVHFVIIISISKVFQVQNKPMGFLPPTPIQTKGLITMKLIHAEYNPIHNSIDINHYNGYILRIDCNQAESGIRTTPNSQRCLNALAIDNPLEYARLALDGEMQAWVDAEDSLEVF